MSVKQVHRLLLSIILLLTILIFIQLCEKSVSKSLKDTISLKAGKTVAL